MKKAITLFLTLAILSSGGSLSVTAASEQSKDKIPEVSVEYMPISTNAAIFTQSLGITDLGIGNGFQKNQVVNLGTNGTANISWTISGKSSTRSSYDYTTASGKIVLRVSGTPAASINFILYTSSNVNIAERTVQVTPNNQATITFSNLSNNKQYYIMAENLSQTSTTVTGTIAAA